MTSLQNALHHVNWQKYTQVAPRFFAPFFLPPTTICFHFVLANVTAGCCCGKLELIGALAKMSQVVTPEAQKHFPY